MITTLPYSTAEIISAIAPRKVAGPGIVDKRLDDGVYVISIAAGKVTVKVSSGSLSEGDAVNVTQCGNELVLQKTGPQVQSSAPAPQDAVDVNAKADPSTLRTIVDTVVDQLKKRILDKPTLDQLQRILAAVSKTPAAFDEDTQKAVSELKSIVSSMPSGDTNTSQVATEITDRIIALGEKLNQQLKSAGGAIDIVLKPEAKLKEGYYKFDSIKTALSWIAENKETSADIPWQKLSAIFKDGQVVLKVYESAIGDTRASLISPDKVNTDIEHFVQSNLKADIWKNIPSSVLVNLLSDRKEIPLERLLQIDKLLSANEGSRPEKGAQTGAAPENTPIPAPKGLEAAFGQWLAIALDKDSPVEALAARAPAPAGTGLMDFLKNIDASRQNSGVAFREPLENEDVALSRSTVINAQRPEAVIIDAFKRLGLDFESALLKSQSADGTDAQAQNLKVRLLALQNAIDSTTSNTEIPDTQKVLMDNKAILLDIAAKLNALVQSAQLTAHENESSEHTQPASKDFFSSLDNAAKALSRLLFGERSAQTPPKPVSEPPAPAPQTDPVLQESGTQAHTIEAVVRSAAKIIEQGLGEGPAQLANVTKEIPAALANFQKELTAALQKLFPQNQEGLGASRHILDLLKPLLEIATRLNVTARTQAQALPAVAEKLSQGIFQFLTETAVQSDTGELFANGFASRPSASAAENAAVVQSRMTKTSDQIEKLVQELLGRLTKLPEAAISIAAKTLDGDALAGLTDLVKNGIAQVFARLMGLSEQVNAFKTAVPAQTQAMREQLEQLMTTPFGKSDSAGQAASSQSSIDTRDPIEQPVVFPQDGPRFSQTLVSEAQNILDAMVKDIGRQISTIQNNIQPETNTPPTQTASTDDSTFLASMRQLDALGADAEASIMRITKECTDMLKELTENASVRLSQLQSGPHAQHDDVKRLAQEFSDIAAAIVSSARQEMQKVIGQNAQQTDAFSAGKEIAGRMQDSGTGNTQQLADKIKDLADMVRDFAQRTVAGEGRLPKELAERITGQTRQQSEIESLTKNILKQLDGAAKSLTETGGRPALRDLAGHLMDLASQTTKLAEKLAPFDRGPLDTLKQQVDQVLTRVESMQVLAKQVSFADNQQQVISLPMKIDGQWTDVVVKFLKRKGPSEKGPSKKNVSVIIHVAPTLLGEVTVFMDYNGKKNFSLRMEFEKTSSREWFENNRTEFSKAMGNFGFPSFKIDMKTSRDRQPIDTVIETALPSAGTIDITA
jgi:hypothetical protein